MKPFYLEEMHWCAFSVWGWGYCNKNPPDWAIERMKDIDAAIFNWELYNIRARAFQEIMEAQKC